MEHTEIINLEKIKEDYKTRKNREKFFYELKKTIGFFLVIISVGIIISSFWVRVLTIYGTSMSPNLTAKDTVVAFKKDQYKSGDVIAFYYNNKVLVKRVIATSGDWVNISNNGNVIINDKEIKEKYLLKSSKSIGKTDIKLPYQVPENKIFVMGDHRSVSIDSRNKIIGSIGKEQIIGKIKFIIWPLSRFDILN